VLEDEWRGVTVCCSLPDFVLQCVAVCGSVL